MIKLHLRRLLTLSALLLLPLTRSWAMTPATVRASDAVQVLKAIENIPDKAIPTDLLRRAHAIAVIPSLVILGFVFGGRYGKGLISVKKAGGTWSDPGFIQLVGGSVGFQIGVSSSDVVLVFATRRGVDSIVNGKFTLGVDAAVVTGPVGRNASASTDGKLHAEIYSYALARGLFAGLSLKGGVISTDYAANAAVYGAGITPRRIFEGGVRNVPTSVLRFRKTLENYTSPSH